LIISWRLVLLLVRSDRLPDGRYRITPTVPSACRRSVSLSYTEAHIGHAMIGATRAPPTMSAHWRYRVKNRMSIFSAISIASSTSMPR
jgi:hypothetical protein